MSTALRGGDPREVGPYRLLSRLGAGGMGTVYLGRDPGGRLVAVKVIQPALADDDEFRARFRSEVNRARQVPPFCTAEVLDADVDHDPPYLVCEYVDGPNLVEVIQESGPLTGGALQSVAVGVATALAAIHSAGVIHRDLKPQNVLFALGNPKVIDFGIAQASEATSKHTRTGELVGTVAYMAPERLDAQGREVSYPADIFSWAVVVAYAATGRTPFDAGSPTGTAVRILTQPPDLTGLPAALHEIVDRALAKDPAERPTAHELVDLLVGNAAVPPARAGAVVRPASSVPPGRRRRLPLILAAAGLVLVLALGYAGSRLYDAASAGPDTATRAGNAVDAALGTTARTTLIEDPLTTAKLWPSHPGGSLKCTYAAKKGYSVGTDSSVAQRCPGPSRQIPADQVITVDVTLETANSCASIWWLDAGENNYQLIFCDDLIFIQRNYGPDDGTQLLLNIDLTANPIPLAKRSRLVIATRDYVTQVFRNGEYLGDTTLKDRSRTTGKVALGIDGRSAGTKPKRYEVSFANIKVESL